MITSVLLHSQRVWGSCDMSFFVSAMPVEYVNVCVKSTVTVNATIHIITILLWRIIFTALKLLISRRRFWSICMPICAAGKLKSDIDFFYADDERARKSSVLSLQFLARMGKLLRGEAQSTDEPPRCS